MSHKCHKTKRRQPAPKKKKKRGNYDKITSNSMLKKFKNYGKELVKVLKNKDALNEIISDEISKIEGYFRYYDSIQLLGGIGLYLIDNLSTLEKTFYAQMSGSHLALDEDAEVIAFSSENGEGADEVWKIINEFCDFVNGKPMADNDENTGDAE